ncbi:uncharacterized protein TrAFT101_010077 [Trichoderma asperellum]|nr:hypothetical protein TrAFT101_010077 [Trichoderma asperellum]
MDCPIINADIRRVAILLLEAVEKSFLRESENGAYIEPGSVLRFTGTRQVLHDSHDFVVTEPVVFVAFPYVELASSRNNHGSRERDDFYPRTLLQNLYGFDVVTSRGKNQVIHKMPASSQPNDTLFVNQLWCLMIGSDILITLSDRPADDLLGDMIGKRTDYFRQPLRIEIVDMNGYQHSMSISSKTPWVDFFRHVILTVHGNLISIMDYELVDQTDEVVTMERWAELAKGTRTTLLKFYLVERKTSASRSSSVSSRRSSRSGIRRLLLLDYAHRDNRHSSKTSVSRYHVDRYNGDSSSSERIAKSKRASTPGRPRYLGFLMDGQWHNQLAKMKDQQLEAQAEFSSKTDTQSLYPHPSPTIITLDSSDEDYPGTEKIRPIPRNSQDFDSNSEGVRDEGDSSLRNIAQLPKHQQLPPLGDTDEGIRLAGPLSIQDHPLTHEQQAPARDSEEQREKAISLEGSFFYIDDEQNRTLKEEASDGPIIKDTASSANNVGTRMSDDGLNECKDTSATQSNTPTTMYKKVQVEDGSESSDEVEIIRRIYDDSTEVILPNNSTEFNLEDYAVLKDEHDPAADNLPNFGNQERSPEKRYIFRNSTKVVREFSHGKYRSRSSYLSNSTDDSLSNSTDDSLYSRGRSRRRRQPAWRRENAGLAHESSSRPGVRFQPQEWHSSDKDNAEMSPFGSSTATKVDALPIQTAVPFFFWKQNSVTSTCSSHDTPEQALIKLLDQIDERISGDPIGRYYSKVPELTMNDVLSRQESLHEPGLGPRIVLDESSQVNRLAGQGTIDIRTGNMFAFRSSKNQAARMNKGGDENNTESVEALSSYLDDDLESKNEAPGTDSKDKVPSLTNESLDRGAQEQTNVSQTQALGLISHDKALAKQLIEISQQIIWSFIPDTGGSVIHTLLKRLWGCVDIMCLQLLWEENQRRSDSECTYIIRNFSSQVKKMDLQRQKLTSGKIHYLFCGDCKAAKPYQSAMDALNHLHEKHIECKHTNSERPYDDPCYVWLHRIWHDGYPMRSSRDGLLGIMEDFIEELSYFSNYVRELHNMTIRDSSASDAISTPPLPMNITHAFQQIVKMFVFRSKQLSLINRRRSLISGSSLENFSLIQRIDRKIEELFSLEMDANERIIDRLESAKKDIFLSGIESHSEMLEAETVRVQFLALALMSGIQRPLLQPSVMGRSRVKDALLQLYKDYTSRLHFQANNRPRKRVFLDIHGLEEELQALDKLLGSQESCLYNALTLIDPLTSRYTTETRFREFRVEVQYGNDQLHQLVERRREIDNLATRLWILKDQVKQTIEIMEEDHGKAIRVFTVVTLFFLPLSFVSSFLGMNTVDVRDSDWNQGIFWITGIPLTLGVLSLAFVYGYKGEEIRDWMIPKLQGRSHQYPSPAFHEMDGRTSLETRRKEWNLATTTDHNATQKTDFKTRVGSKIKNISGWQRQMNEAFKVSDGPDGKVSIRRRNTEDSLAPMRH